MGMQSLLRKVFLIDLLQGLKVTFRYQDPKEIYTEQYPMERPQVAERYRGAPRLNVNPDTDETMCIACDLCALACPENLIVVSSARNEHTRRKELTNFTYDLSRCMFCGLCEDACPVDALELTQDFELASYTREGWIWDRKTLKKVRSLRSIRSSPGTVPTLCHSEPGDSPVRNLLSPTRSSLPGRPSPRPNPPK